MSPAARSDPLRVALVGCGHISAMHLRAWRQVPRASVVALCDISRSALDARRAEFGIEAGFESLESLLAGIEVDAIDLCTTPERRLPLIEAAARAGKHLLVQKPLALTVEEGQRMCRVAEHHGVLLAVKENWRFYPWYRAIAARLRTGAVGEVLRVEIRRTCWGSPKRGWRVWKEQPYLLDRQQGVWYEVGVHIVDTLRHLLGEPDDVNADMVTLSPLMQGEDIAHVSMRFGSAIVTCDHSWAERGGPQRPGADVVRIDGRRARIELCDDGRVLHKDDAGRVREILPVPTEPELASHVGSQADFTEALRLRRAPATSGRHHLRTLQIVLAAYESAAQRRRIPLRESPWNG